MKIASCKVLDITLVSGNYFLATFELPSTSHRPARPGQFVLIQAQSNTTNPLLKVPLAVFDQTLSTMMVLCQIRGQKTLLLSKQLPGGRVEILMPLGNSFELHKAQKTAVLIAGGCGIASLYLLAKRLRQQDVAVILFFGARSQQEIVEVARFKELGCSVLCATDDSSLGFRGNVVDLFLNNYPGDKDFQVYASGPSLMLRRIALLAKEKSFDAQLSFESYMACGIGVCKGCAVDMLSGYKLCCQDGPVFKAEDVV